MRAEAKKHPDEAQAYAGPVDPALLAAPEEQGLFDAVRAMTSELDDLLRQERFAEAMAELARLRQPVDAFFDKVLVNAEDPAVRLNRLRLLSGVQAAMSRVADFSQVAGA